ncbi:hypothetical protein EB001_01040 [bacterium]|nr:hypothetical protein [bacterium]
MTPYELRFEIFKQANGLAQDKYHAAFAIVEQWNEHNSVKTDYPDFPSYEEIEALADKINAFVSKN